MSAAVPELRGVIEGEHTMQTVTLNNGVEMPLLGLFRIPAEQTEQVVADAVAAGTTA